MQVTNIGSSSTYIYNAKTGKLSTKDGSPDHFVDYFNADGKEDLPDSLTGYERRRKSELNNMLMFFQSGHKGIKDVFHGQDGDEYEITCEMEDAATTQFSVNGEKVFQAYDAKIFHYMDTEKITGRLFQKLKAQAGGQPESGAQPDKGARFAVSDSVYREALKKYAQALSMTIS